MDQYALVHFVIKKNDHSYAFLAQVGVSYEEAISALGQFITELSDQKKAAEDAAKATEAQPVEMVAEAIMD